MPRRKARRPPSSSASKQLQLNWTVGIHLGWTACRSSWLDSLAGQERPTIGFVHPPDALKPGCAPPRSARFVLIRGVEVGPTRPGTGSTNNPVGSGSSAPGSGASWAGTGRYRRGRVPRTGTRFLGFRGVCYVFCQLCLLCTSGSGMIPVWNTGIGVQFKTGPGSFRHRC